MAIDTKPLLSADPTNIVHQPVTIGHIQLRDLVICPEERGLVNYAYRQSIMERDVTKPASAATTLVNLRFIPNTIASLNIPNSDERLLAAGGQDAELHLSIHRQRNASLTSEGSSTSRSHHMIPGASINNSVLLTSLNLTQSNESSAEPRVAVSNNDRTVKFYDVVLPRRPEMGPAIHEAGVLQLDVPVNHSSISPDGRTLLSVGDSPHVYLHALAGGRRLTFSQLMTLSLPAHDVRPVSPSSNTGPASFSTAFSACGTKFAVASQEGMVVVWDVRSTKPLKIYQTDRTRTSEGHWYDEPWDWTHPGNTAPGWGVRNLKFSPAGHGGKEIMTFTEHTSLLHVVDATTFEEEQIVRVPSIASDRVPFASTAAPESWTSATPPPPPPPAHQPRVYLTSLEYTRRGVTISPARAAYIRRQRSRGLIVDDEDENAPIVVQMPSLGDRSAERDARRVLGRHGVRTTGPAEDSGEYDIMEVDELEPDCVSSRTPSRAPSPAPSAPRRRYPVANTPAAVAAPASTPTQRDRKLTVPPHLDIAGLCFDPTGRYLYTGTVDGIVEWGVRGAEKTWWSASAWA